MKISKTIKSLFIAFSILFSLYAFGGVEKIFILKEIDDDNIIIVTESGEQLLLEKWSMRFSPLSFEGKYFIAEVTPAWVTIHFENRASIKWAIEKSLGNIRSTPSATRDNTSPDNKTDQCFRSMIKKPSPFLGNGGEIIVLDDGSMWKEVSYQYLYLYEYYPSAIVCPNEGKMIVGKNVFRIIPAK